ncbi:MAG: hypothetical protein ACD_22C00148G0004 [uncultured bacterium]|nr:MAG: hypothetical protein ACD_22C00148G0004 [uncultured bacterium]
MTKEMEERLNSANTLREEEKYGESSKLYTECLLELIKLNDAEGLIHALGGQSLIYKIQSRKENSLVYRNLTIAFAKEVNRIAEENKNKLDGRTLSIAYRSWADAILMDERPKEALPIFEKSFAVSTASVCEKGSVKAHIGGIKYLIGEKEEGKRIILEALADIRTGDMDAYAPRVWETGCLNGLAKMYALEGDKELALKTINEAIQIDKDHNLTIRLRESQEILDKINKGENNFSL